MIPARVRKPRDKAKAEAGVLLVERWILAVLRRRTYIRVPARQRPEAPRPRAADPARRPGAADRLRTARRCLPPVWCLDAHRLDHTSSVGAGMTG